MTTTATPQNDVKVTQLTPYIFFYGRCEEALKFYEKALRGTYELQRIGESPMAGEAPAETHNNVMHSRFTAPGITFMAADGRDVKAIDPEAGNISLTLEASERAEGERLFKALSEGGKAKMPLEDAFWGGRFGILDDKFGNEWMIISP